MEHQKLIKDLGGTTRLGRIFGLTPPVVNHWRYRGIPWRYRYKIMLMAQAKGIKLPEDFMG